VSTGRIAASFALCALGSSAALAETRFASLTVENDFFAGCDRHYTNGVQLAVLADLRGAPQWLHDASADPHAVVAIGQRIYTPAKIDIDPPDPLDRPYAGWLYVMGDLRTRAAPTIDHLTLTVGVVGPASGARETQVAVHRVLGDKEPRGWDAQVRDRATLMVGYERAWPGLAHYAFAGHEVDLALRAGGSVGTPLSYANVGAVLRWGTNLPNDLPVTHISLGPPRDGFRGAPAFGWYAWIGADGRAVGYNTFIEGTTFAGGAHVKRRTWGDDVQVGMAAAWAKARVGFTLVQRSSEFEGQRGSDRFGQVAVSFAY
jgi:hypothetical protein